jgi:hypothetical protein
MHYPCNDVMSVPFHPPQKGPSSRLYTCTRVGGHAFLPEAERGMLARRRQTVPNENNNKKKTP